MSLRPPRLGQTSATERETGLSALEAEMMSEAAAALGRAGSRAEAALARLTDPEALAEAGREVLLRQAAEEPDIGDPLGTARRGSACGRRGNGKKRPEAAPPPAAVAELNAI